MEGKVLSLAGSQGTEFIIFWCVLQVYSYARIYSIAHDNSELPCIKINQKETTEVILFLKYQNFYHSFLKLDNIFTERSFPLF